MEEDSIRKGMSTKQVAMYLGISEATVCQLIRDGELGALQLKQKYIIMPLDLAEFETTHRVRKGE